MRKGARERLRAWLIGLESLVTASVGHGLCSIDVDLMTGSLNLK